VINSINEGKVGDRSSQ